ncbi:hypothetical protein AB1Y20_008083 [Prymnesium parvum]|uniref:Uncharacterized protein n=1 Tax=Prymnesium parvum TaxID=97485 RepID=A0AB34IVL1_PRYPA
MRCLCRSTATLLHLLLIPRAALASRKIDAVLVIHDDSVHTFQDVSSALEAVGFSPPDALLHTQTINDVGFDVIAKGTFSELEKVGERLAQLNVSVIRMSAIDAAVQRAAWQLRNVSRTPLTSDVSSGCALWAVAGACFRQPLFMSMQCTSSCRVLGVRYFLAARTREPPSVKSMAQLLLGGGSLLVGSLLLGAAGVARHRASDREWNEMGMKVATALLMQQQVVDALRALVFHREEGFHIDDADGMVFNLQDDLHSNTTAPPSDASDSPVWAAWVAAGLNLVSTLGHVPTWMGAIFGAVQCAAAVCALRGRCLQLSGAVVLSSALLGAAHVALSAFMMHVTGAGMYISELMAKRIALAGGVALWVSHVLGCAIGKQALLPLIAAHPSMRQMEDMPATSHALLLLAGRLTIAAFVAVVCGSELSRTAFSPLSAPEMVGSWSTDPSGAMVKSEEQFLQSVNFDERVQHEHTEILLRCPQFILALPLAIGLSTERIACALAILTLTEAFAVWQWWLPQTLADPMRLARVVEHFSVNLAIAGSLLLLPLRGCGHFTLDALMVKKHD